MKCPLLFEQRLDPTKTADLEKHMESCVQCATFRVEQAALWAALDEWEPPPVSMSFNRRLWQKIDDAASAPWHRKVADALRFGAWKPAFPLAAALVVVAVGFVLDHRNTSGASGSGVSLSEADQVENTLDDIQLLKQFDAASRPI